ncbi:unnamed protein product [Blepharisma stoltei]|uniref:Uncharacterized protein n=1 Tax=Blepharisma stoltei TaxID=1481888 RepID=A0AAU9JFN4_9CILI|nr:unnamed protein product [Blepharisma stoltei]
MVNICGIWIFFVGIKNIVFWYKICCWFRSWVWVLFGFLLHQFGCSIFMCILKLFLAHLFSCSWIYRMVWI